MRQHLPALASLLLMMTSPAFAQESVSPPMESLPDPVSNLSTADRSKKCEAAHTALYYAPETAKDLCQFNDRVTRTESPDFNDCLARLDSASIKDKFAPICFYFQTRELTDQVLHCIKDSAPSHQSWYWHFEDNISLSEAKRPHPLALLGPSKTADGLLKAHFRLPLFMNRLMFDCRTPSVAKIPSTRVRVAAEAIYHTHHQVPGRRLLLGGLSGLTKTDNDELLAITDDKNNPAIYRFGFETKGPHLAIWSKGSIDLPFLKGSGADLEDLSLRKDGSIFISSEMSKSDIQQQPPAAGAAQNPLDDEPDTFIFKLDPHLTGAKAVLLPEYLFPSSKRVEIPCPLPPEDPAPKTKSSDGLFKSIFTTWLNKDETAGTESADAESEISKPPKACFSTLWSGIKWNKGLEAMTIDKETDQLIFAPEQPLAHADDQTSVPIFIMDLNHPESRRPVAIYQYPLESQFDNGIVAITKWGPETYLTLERGFNPAKQAAIVKLYKIKLAGDPRQKIKKELIVDFDQIAPTFAPGFRSVENFEGLVAGPPLATGERTLFVVSDNNFNLNQKTVLLALALKPGI